jgi:dTDP-4-amino-4,6-dideoxygalactose transaminase
MSEREFIPFHRPSIDESEIEAVASTLRSGWLTTGPRTAHFEAEFRAYVQAPYALAVNSCTAGLHLALAALGIGPGDEVITSPMTFCSTVNCILHTGAAPVLADVGSDGNIDPDCIRAAITERTRVILPVHYAGLPCDMAPIWAMARERGIHVIEDAAHAAGARYGGRPIGGSGSTDAAAFSFYATKNLTTGEGGMLTCHRPEVWERARILCLHGIGKDAWERYTEKGNWYYEVVDCGFKYNLSDIQSAIGIEQLHKLERFLTVREQIAGRYTQSFRELPELEPPAGRGGCRHAWHLYPLRLNLDRLAIDRREFIEELRRRGIGASVHFIPIPMHPYFARNPGIARAQCPRALEMYPRLISLPLYPALTDEEIEYIISSVAAIVRENRRALIVAAAR